MSQHGAAAFMVERFQEGLFFCEAFCVQGQGFWPAWLPKKEYFCPPTCNPQSRNLTVTGVFPFAPDAEALPEEYDLTLEPDLEHFTFDGIVKITCDVQVATDTVSVHAMDLVLSQAVFRPSGSTSVIKADEITTKARVCHRCFFVHARPLFICFRGQIEDSYPWI